MDELNPKTKNKGIVPQSNELGPQSVSPNLLRRQSVKNVTLFFLNIHTRNVKVLYVPVMN